MSYNIEPWALEQYIRDQNAGYKSDPLTHRVSSRKRICFSKTCNVILIPCRQEYFEASIDLWHQSDVFLEAKQEASQEIKGTMDKHGMGFQEAVKFLYQPPPNENDFVACNLLAMYDEDNDCTVSQNMAKKVPVQVPSPVLSQVHTHSHAHDVDVSVNMPPTPSSPSQKSHNSEKTQKATTSAPVEQSNDLLNSYRNTYENQLTENREEKKREREEKDEEGVNDSILSGVTTHTSRESVTSNGSDLNISLHSYNSSQSSGSVPEGESEDIYTSINTASENSETSITPSPTTDKEEGGRERHMSVGDYSADHHPVCDSNNSKKKKKEKQQSSLSIDTDIDDGSDGLPATMNKDGNGYVTVKGLKNNRHSSMRDNDHFKPSPLSRSSSSSSSNGETSYEAGSSSSSTNFASINGSSSSSSGDSRDGVSSSASSSTGDSGDEEEDAQKMFNHNDKTNKSDASSSNIEVRVASDVNPCPLLHRCTDENDDSPSNSDDGGSSSSSDNGRALPLYLDPVQGYSHQKQLSPTSPGPASPITCAYCEIEVLLVTTNTKRARDTAMSIQKRYPSYQWKIEVATSADQVLIDLKERQDSYLEYLKQLDETLVAKLENFAIPTYANNDSNNSSNGDGNPNTSNGCGSDNAANMVRNGSMVSGSERGREDRFRVPFPVPTDGTSVATPPAIPVAPKPSTSIASLPPPISTTSNSSNGNGSTSTPYKSMRTLKRSPLTPPAVIAKSPAMSKDKDGDQRRARGENKQLFNSKDVDAVAASSGDDCASPVSTGRKSVLWSERGLLSPRVAVKHRDSMDGNRHKRTSRSLRSSLTQAMLWAVNNAAEQQQLLTVSPEVTLKKYTLTNNADGGDDLASGGDAGMSANGMHSISNTVKPVGQYRKVPLVAHSPERFVSAAPPHPVSRACDSPTQPFREKLINSISWSSLHLPRQQYHLVLIDEYFGRVESDVDSAGTDGSESKMESRPTGGGSKLNILPNEEGEYPSMETMNLLETVLSLYGDNIGFSVAINNFDEDDFKLVDAKDLSEMTNSKLDKGKEAIMNFSMDKSKNGGLTLETPFERNAGSGSGSAASNGGTGTSSGGGTVSGAKSWIALEGMPHMPELSKKLAAVNSRKPHIIGSYLQADGDRRVENLSNLFEENMMEGSDDPRHWLIDRDSDDSWDDDTIADIIQHEKDREVWRDSHGGCDSWADDDWAFKTVDPEERRRVVRETVRERLFTWSDLIDDFNFIIID